MVRPSFAEGFVAAVGSLRTARDSASSGSSGGPHTVVDPSRYVSPTGDLITAIQNANAAGVATTITLAANTTFDFASSDNATDGSNALPVITGNITIIGNGDTLERSGTAAFRLFDVASGGSLTLENLTLPGGMPQGRLLLEQTRRKAARSTAPAP